MGEDELKQSIETNFRLYLMDNRQLGAGLRSVAEQTANLAAQVSGLADKVDTNTERLEETVEAIKTLAFQIPDPMAGSVTNRKEPHPPVPLE